LDLLGVTDEAYERAGNANCRKTGETLQATISFANGGP